MLMRQAVADKNASSCWCRYDHETGPCTSIVDLTSNDDIQAADSDEGEYVMGNVDASCPM